MSMDSYIGSRPINEVTGTRREWTATEGQDTFLVSYVPGYVDVFLQGAKLAETDFTATDGTSVVLASGASAGDTVAVIAWARGEMMPVAEVYSSFSRKNAIINGCMRLWQRGTSQTANGYGSADHWTFSSAGSSHSVTQQTFTVGQTDVPGNPTYYMQNAVTSSAGASNYSYVVQKIEGVRTFAGETVTLTFYAKAASGTPNIAIETLQHFGTVGSPSATVTGIDVQTVALTSSWAKYEVQIDVPSISGKTLGTNEDDHIAIVFWLDAGSDFDSRTNSLGQQSITLSLAQVQLELGIAATAFERRPMAEEVELCQRYYEKSYLINVDPGTATSVGQYRMYLGGIANSSHTNMGTITLSTAKRAVPTVTPYSPTTGTAGSGYDGVSNRVVTISQPGQKSFAYYMATTTANVVVDASLQWAADAEL